MIIIARLTKLKSPAGKKCRVLAKRQVNTPSNKIERERAIQYPKDFFLNIKNEDTRSSVPKRVPEDKEARLPEKT